jgi:hypothetical protein
VIDRRQSTDGESHIDRGARKPTHAVQRDKNFYDSILILFLGML